MSKRQVVVGDGGALRSLKTLLAVTLLLGAFAALVFPLPARASLVWSSPIPVDRTAVGDLSSVACPSGTQCTAVDLDGQELTFNPSSPGHVTHALIDLGAGLGQVVCPSISQCTTIDDSGREVTFNPTAPGTPAPVRVESQGGLSSNFLACPSTRQCTLIGSGGEITFDPTSPGTPTPIPLNDNVAGIEAFACASTTECTAVDDLGGEITFNPTAPGTPSRTVVAGTRPLQGLACPSGSECIATSSSLAGGNVAVVFNPTVGSATSVVALGTPDAPATLTCASPSRCTVVDFLGNEATFDPTSSGGVVVARIDTLSTAGAAILSVSCPLLTACTAVDPGGREVTFDPTSPGSPSPVMIDTTSGSRMLGVACPSIGQCTAIDAQGHEVTFDPSAPGSPLPLVIDGTSSVTAIACPAISQCTAVGHGIEVTFDPRSPGTVAPATIDSSAALTAVACPSSRQCTAVDSAGHEVTFDPTAPGSPTPATIDATSGLIGIACPSTTQCTAIDADRELTFDPASPATTTSLTLGFRVLTLEAVACPTSSQCTVAGNVAEFTINPASPAPTQPRDIESAGGFTTSIACPASTRCVAVDSAGAALEFDPTTAAPVVRTTILGGRELLAVDCPSTGQCTAVSEDGFELTGSDSTPTSTLVQPAAGTSNVSPYAAVYSVFSLPMDEAATAAAFSLTDDTSGRSVPGKVVWFGPTLPIFVSSDGHLQPGDSYTATISTSARSAGGVQLAAPVRWSFEVAPNPIVTVRLPAARASGVYPHAPTIAVFSQAMNETAVQAEFSLNGPRHHRIHGSFSWFGPTVMIFTPRRDLRPGVTYTATISATATDRQGNPLLAATSWSYTTARHR